MISPETYDKPERKLIGSLMVFEAESLEEVRKVIEDDVYYRTGVVRSIFRLVCADADADVQWDKEKLTILPWISAHPLPPFVPEA